MKIIIGTVKEKEFTFKVKRRSLAQDTSGIMKISRKNLKAIMEENGIYEIQEYQDRC